MRTPNILSVRQVVESAAITKIKIGARYNTTKWVPSRPAEFPGFEYRLKAAWMVFTGRADAVYWEGQ